MYEFVSDLNQLTYKELNYTIETIKEAIRMVGRSAILEEYLRQCRKNREKRLIAKQTLVTGDYMFYITKQVFSAKEELVKIEDPQCVRYKKFTKPNGDIVLFRFFEKEEI